MTTTPRELPAGHDERTKTFGPLLHLNCSSIIAVVHKPVQERPLGALSKTDCDPVVGVDERNGVGEIGQFLIAELGADHLIVGVGRACWLRRRGLRPTAAPRVPD